MGKQKYLFKIRELFDKSPVVSFDSIQRIIQEKKKTNYSKLFIRNLLEKGEIKRLSKGFYTKHNEAVLSVFYFRPSYLGMQSALSFYNLWDQETIPVIITTRKVRSGIRKVMGTNILVRRINRKYLFGFDLVQEGSFYLPFSDIEKTFIDLVVFNEKISPDLLKNFRKVLNIKKLNSYLSRYPIPVRKKVLKILKIF